MHTDRMHCTKCKARTSVIDTRTTQMAEDNDAQYSHLTLAQVIWHGDTFRSRRRRCKLCDHEFDTIEVPIREIE